MTSNSLSNSQRISRRIASWSRQTLRALMPTPHVPLWLESVCHDYAGVEFVIAFGWLCFWAVWQQTRHHSPGWAAEALRASARSLSPGRERGAPAIRLKLQGWCCTPRRFESAQLQMGSVAGVEFVTACGCLDVVGCVTILRIQRRRSAMDRLL